MELLRQHEADIEALTLVPSQGGRFEVVVDGQLLYSKLATGRHPEPGEVPDLVDKFIHK